LGHRAAAVALAALSVIPSACGGEVGHDYGGDDVANFVFSNPDNFTDIDARIEEFDLPRVQELTVSNIDIKVYTEGSDRIDETEIAQIFDNIFTQNHLINGVLRSSETTNPVFLDLSNRLLEVEQEFIAGTNPHQTLNLILPPDGDNCLNKPMTNYLVPPEPRSVDNFDGTDCSSGLGLTVVVKNPDEEATGVMLTSSGSYDDAVHVAYIGEYDLTAQQSADSTRRHEFVHFLLHAGTDATNTGQTQEEPFIQLFFQEPFLTASGEVSTVETVLPIVPPADGVEIEPAPDDEIIMGPVATN